MANQKKQKHLHERFEQVVREALAELGFRFRSPQEAIEAWLDFLLRESAFSRGTAITELGAASKHELAELRVLAREYGNRPLADALGRLEAKCEFPKSLEAILRVDFCMLPEEIRLRAANEEATESPGEGTVPQNTDMAAGVMDAIKLFELQPGFPEAQVWMRDRMTKLRLSGTADCRRFGTNERAKWVLSYYNIRAAALHRLISNIETQNAFIVWLEHLGHLAWYEFTGIGTPTEIREGAPSIESGIIRRNQWWTRKGYKRLADLLANQRARELEKVAAAEHAGGDNSTVGGNGADRRGSSWQSDELTDLWKPEDKEAAERSRVEKPQIQSPRANVRVWAVEKRYPKRAAWLETQLALRKWNVHDLQAQAGPDWKTARKILDGLQVSRSVLEKTAAALSKKNKQVLFRDIPQE